MGGGLGSDPHGVPHAPGRMRLLPHPTFALVGGVPVGSHKGMEFGHKYPVFLLSAAKVEEGKAL